ncbi:hypothetical protein OG976_16605 [Mycobacterium sp. NBC_00419]|uniref:hypothetical protein n=1 Tax=Mycobacterium sp. NBC_00419 TaxID=2975989 RepID=UPI002E22BCA5
MEQTPAIYEIVFEGTSPGEVLVKAGCGMAGAWLLGEGGATFGGMVAGPPGAFAGALILGTVGGIVGEKGAGAMIDWLKE